MVIRESASEWKRRSAAPERGIREGSLASAFQGFMGRPVLRPPVGIEFDRDLFSNSN